MDHEHGVRVPTGGARARSSRASAWRGNRLGRSPFTQHPKGSLATFSSRTSRRTDRARPDPAGAHVPTSGRDYRGRREDRADGWACKGILSPRHLLVLGLFATLPHPDRAAGLLTLCGHPPAFHVARGELVKDIWRFARGVNPLDADSSASLGLSLSGYRGSARCIRAIASDHPAGPPSRRVSAPRTSPRTSDVAVSLGRADRIHQIPWSEWHSARAPATG